MTHDPTPLPEASVRRRPPLVLAGHGTRDDAGAADAHTLLTRVRTLLPDVDVSLGFVELRTPSIVDALSAALTQADAAVVVPLMLGTGGHVREDVPKAIDAGRRSHPDATVAYTRHLGAPPPLVALAVARIDEARGEWAAGETAVVFVGRGCSVTDANADHVRLARVVAEQGGYAQVQPAFVQVTDPSVTQALQTARLAGTRRIVVMPHCLFRGRLEQWVRDEAGRFAADHPDVEVRVASVLGPCDALAEVVAQRYREGELRARTDPGSPAYLSGLLLAGRRVVAVGGGCVNRRRVPALLAAGARVVLVAPQAHEALTELAASGRLEWRQKGYEASDLEGAWYVLAATDSPETNARIAADAEARHTFCVRADRADLGSAWTPATGVVEGATVAVLAHRDPRRSRDLRDRLVGALEGQR